jgi:transcriptional regulator with XRE-family HTH domain
MILRKLREEKKLSQEQLAMMAGVSTRTIQRIESGYKASYETLKALASVLEVNISTLEEEIDMTEDTIRQSEYDRPQHVTYAVLALFGTLVLAALAAVVSKWTGEISAGEFVINILWYSLLCIIPYKIYNGSNAARFIFLIMMISSYFLWLGGMMSELSVADRIASFISMPIELCVTYLLFNKTSSPWFTKHVPSVSAEA